MSLKAIIATVLLGTSSLAAADTIQYDSHVEVRDHRTQRPERPIFQRPPVQVRPVTLASSLRINGRDIIKVTEQTRAFTKLELQSTAGRTSLDKVLIQFGNGQTQTIDCNRTLNGNESFSIDLAGNQRNIKRIVLVGKAGRRAAVNVVAV